MLALLLLLLYCTPNTPTQHGWEISDRTNKQAALYAAAARDVAKQQGVPLLDIHTVFSQAGPQQVSQLLNDGVHFSPQGQELVFKSLRELIEKSPELAGVRTGDLPNHYPLFDQVDAANPGKTFRELFERQGVVGAPGASGQQPGRKVGGPTQ